MCWITFVKPVKKVAKEDIKVYKILRKYGNRITSPVRKTMEWEIGKLVDLRKPLYYRGGNICNAWILKEGFHSLIDCPVLVPTYCGKEWTIEKNDKCLFQCDRGESVYECVIPAGSTYYENEYGEVVSDRLIVLKKC